MKSFFQIKVIQAQGIYDGKIKLSQLPYVAILYGSQK